MDHHGPKWATGGWMKEHDYWMGPTNSSAVSACNINSLPFNAFPRLLHHSIPIISIVILVFYRQSESQSEWSSWVVYRLEDSSGNLHVRWSDSREGGNVRWAAGPKSGWCSSDRCEGLNRAWIRVSWSPLQDDNWSLSLSSLEVFLTEESSSSLLVIIKGSMT